MSAHTPGPWTVERNGVGELAPFGPDGRHLLASNGYKPLPLEERAANARLIAAAPDLLEALKATARELSLVTHVGRTLDQADKAIRKAMEPA